MRIFILYASNIHGDFSEILVSIPGSNTVYNIYPEYGTVTSVGGKQINRKDKWWDGKVRSHTYLQVKLSGR